ncbi:hypothetical protein [Leifsonia aquatica]|uniref:hypothetical protein n=1 Tax=Leifsonia aquatica TaxID=144185 RepID=UPI0037F408E0
MHATPPRLRSKRFAAAGVSCALLATSGAFAGTVVTSAALVAPTSAPAASAATYNPAFGGYDSKFGGWLGAVELANGILAYCLQPSQGDATGENVAKPIGGYVDHNGNPLPDDAVAKIGYVLDTYGQQHDKVTNQAVALYAYAWTGFMDGSHPLGSIELGLKYDGTNNPAVEAKFRQIWGDANDPGHYNTGPTTGEGVLDFTVDPNNNFRGTVVMTGTAGSVGTIVLTNGLFADTKTNVATGVPAGVALDVESDGSKKADGTLATIKGAGTFTPPGGGWGPGIQVWSSGGGQDVGSGGQQVVPGPFEVAGADPAARVAPSVKTKAREAVTAGNVNKDDFTWKLLPPQGADIKIVYYADELCSVPVYTYETHVDRPATGPNQGTGSTDEFEVKKEWIDDVTGVTIGHFTEEISVPDYNWTSGPSECGQEGENTKMTKDVPGKPNVPSNDTPPATTPPVTPPATTPAALVPELPVVAG